MKPTAPQSFHGAPAISQPTAFAPGTGSTFYDIAQATRPVAPAPVAPEKPIVVQPPAPPTISISYTKAGTPQERFFASLSKTLAALVAADGGRFELNVPDEVAGEWFIDMRPKPGRGTCLRKAKSEGSAWLPLPAIAPQHFMAKRGKDLVVQPVLRFIIGPEVSGHAGYYQLLPQA